MKRLFLFAVLALILTSAYFYFHSEDPFFPRLGSPPVSTAKLEKILEESALVLEKNPKNLSALVDQGVANFLMGPEHYAESLNALTEAWRGGAFDERIFYYLGILYENLSIFDEAEKQYLRFLNHEPEDREVRLRLARLSFRMGKWRESITQYQKLIDKNPMDVTSLVNLGLACQLRHKTESSEKGKRRKSDAEIANLLDRGIQNLESAAALDPNLPKGIYLALSQMYASKGLWDKALAAAQTELAKYPGEKDKECYAILAQAHEKLDQKENLLETYQKWGKIDPKNSSLPHKIRRLKKQLKIK